MRLADQNIRKAFVVAQQHVVLWLELFDQVLLKQQRFGFCLGGQKHHRRGFTDHPGDPPRVPRRPRIIGHPRAQVTRLAHIKHPRLRIEHAIDAR